MGRRVLYTGEIKERLTKAFEEGRFPTRGGNHYVGNNGSGCAIGIFLPERAREAMISVEYGCMIPSPNSLSISRFRSLQEFYIYSTTDLTNLSEEGKSSRTLAKSIIDLVKKSLPWVKLPNGRPLPRWEFWESVQDINDGYIPGDSESNLLERIIRHIEQIEELGHLPDGDVA